MIQITTATKKLAALKKRIRAVSGGTSASKTISILMVLIDYCQTHDNEIVSVTSESFPHLKRGAIRDFVAIMDDRGYYKDERWNRTDFIYTFETNSKLEFFSIDQSSKVRGPRRDVLFINEANNIPRDTFDQLEVRTKKIIWMDWNPANEFWFYTDILGHREDVDFITLTYLDNEALDSRIVAAIESRKHNKQWWQVYGLGQLGEVEGRIYTDWQILPGMPDFPHEAKLWRYGLDFGYTNDPTAGVAIYEYNGGYILDEVIYQRGMQNSDIADVFKNRHKALIVADSAEPKSIDELSSYGLNVIASTKGRDSINNGIQYVQDQRISVTQRSTNIIKEYRNYLWEQDRDGKPINSPSDVFNHSMDAIRYALTSGHEMKWKPPTDFGGVKPFYDGLPG